MKDLNKAIEKYNFLFNKAIDDNRQILIDSFTLYYGKKYRDFIENQINSIIYLTYIYWADLDFFVKEYIPQENNRKKYKEAIDFYKLKKLCNDDFSIVGTTDPNIIKNQAIINTIKSMPKCPLSNFFDKSKSNNPNTLNIISFPLFYTGESALIHEINHVLSHKMLLLVEDNRLINKDGLQVFEDENIFNELINEKMSLEICDIFKSKGGNFQSICLDVNFGSIYQENFYFVDYFFEEFREIIKESVITLNKNALINRVGKENFQVLVNITNTYYSNQLLLISTRRNFKEDVIREIVEKMKKNCKNLSDEEYENYIKSLKESGKKITLIKNSLR